MKLFLYFGFVTSVLGFPMNHHHRSPLPNPVMLTSFGESSDVQIFTRGASSVLQASRREALQTGATAFLSSFLIGVSEALAAPTYPADVSEKTVFITGANSGIGFDAASRMAARGCTVILACRTLKKAEDTVSRISSELRRTDLKLVPLECDLASLESIRSCVSRLPNGKIDILCLNAGLARDVGSKDLLRTKDGFELTIGTNHLGHFYLTNLLLRDNKVEPKSGRIVVTASGVHDPDSPGGAQGSLATLGNLDGMASGPAFEMIDGAPFDPDKAYKDSKLCNVFFTQELQKRLGLLGGENNNIKAYCFNPGLIVGTGLFREQNKIFTKIFDIAATDLLKVGENTHFGGGCLEYMALSSDLPISGGAYYTSPPGSSKYGDDAFGNQFQVTEVSKEAHDYQKGERLWNLSEKLVGLS